MAQQQTEPFLVRASTSRHITKPPRHHCARPVRGKPPNQTISSARIPLAAHHQISTVLIARAPTSRHSSYRVLGQRKKLPERTESDRIMQFKCKTTWRALAASAQDSGRAAPFSESARTNFCSVTNQGVRGTPYTTQTLLTIRDK